MGNPKFALPSLESLLQSKHEVKAVVSNPPKPMGRKRALKHIMRLLVYYHARRTTKS